MSENIKHADDENFFENIDFSEISVKSGKALSGCDVDILTKRVKSAAKAVKAGRDLTELLNTMCSKGVPNQEAFAIVHILYKLGSVKEETVLTPEIGISALELQEVDKEYFKVFLVPFGISPIAIKSNLSKGKGLNSLDAKKNNYHGKAFACLLFSIIAAVLGAGLKGAMLKDPTQSTRVILAIIVAVVVYGSSLLGFIISIVGLIKSRGSKFLLVIACVLNALLLAFWIMGAMKASEMQNRKNSESYIEDEQSNYAWDKVRDLPAAQ
jgi:hypothetical protein